MPKPHRTAVDAETIVVRVPIAFRRRGGSKTVTTPDGSPAFVPARAHFDGALVKAVARAFRWRKLIETGAHATVQEIADTENVNASYVSRILRLTLLEPNVVEGILDGRQKPDITLSVLVRPLPVEWERQPNILAR